MRTTERLTCGVCGERCEHLRLADARGGSSNEDGWWALEWDLLWCEGCGALAMAWSDYCDGDMPSGREDGDDWEQPRDWIPLHTRVSLRRRVFGLLPGTVQAALQESAASVALGLRTLAGAGLRLTMELMCKEQGASEATLEKRLDALVASHSLGRPAVDALHACRLVGNDAVHDGIPLDDDELEAAIAAVCSALESVYGSGDLESRLKKRKGP